MAEQLLSPAWYRVANLRPRIRSHVRILRHEYRGERWYVLEDRISRRTHRFNPAAYFIVGLMDGRRTMQEIWDGAAERLGDDSPTQEEVVQILGQLHFADVMQCEVPSDVEELLRRSQRVSRRSALARWLAPLAIKFPLFDPDRILERALPWYRKLFGPAGALLWLLVVGWGAVSALQHWDLLTKDLSSRVLAADNLLIIALVFPLVKAAHEFGHACAVKAWGGETHEMGIMLLVLMPIPYVDASAANAFAQRWRRIVVGAAGMIVELFIASIALFFWLEMQPGVARAMLFNVMLIAGVSTVLFNANPLLRFDGYYILSDWLDIPNLRQRAQQYLTTAFQRRVFGLPLPPVDAPVRERLWLVFYAIASYIYRWFITFAIAIFVASEYLIFGVLLAIWAAIAAVVMPLVALIAYVGWSPRLRRRRLRAIMATGLIMVLLGVLVFVVPVPSWTSAQGVVSVPEEMHVRGRADGFVTRVLVQPGSLVRLGDVLVETDDPVLRARAAMLEAQREELESRYQKERQDNIARSQSLLEQLKAAEAELARVRERQRDLVLRSPADGRFTVPMAQDLPGRFVKQGETVGYVIPGTMMTTRVVVPQQSVDMVRYRTDRVTVRLTESFSEVLPARILREVPRASDRLPNMALAQAGGGDVALDPAQSNAPQALQTHFEFEIAISAARASAMGARAYVRFDHPDETLAVQMGRALRQLFLNRFNV
ncbi:MAG: PqqD family peptide modification chaperone [Betaproteobacteria bacterium]|nr:PqqD family peptide modification chaperone [Betaproteobacteria bacterium]